MDIKKVNIEVIRPWADRTKENTMVEIIVDGAVIGYVWKKERRFPVLAGKIKIGETAKKGYAYAHANQKTECLGHTRTRQDAIESLMAFHQRA